MRQSRVARLGSELGELVAEIGLPLAKTTLLTRWVSPAYPRATWRLRFAGGPTLKGIRFNTPAAADRVARLLALLGEQHFPRVLARRGSAMLLQWIAGRSPGEGARRAEFLRRSARLHAWIHSVALNGAAAEAAGSGSSWSVRLEAAFGELERRGVRLSAEVRALGGAARERAPAAATTGLAHGDFCPENLIVRRRERICVIDNETLQVDALDYDLARTWYRWPMRPDDWARYRAAYGEHRDLAEFESHFPFWSVLVLTESAVWHLARGTGGAAVPLRRLGALARLT